MEVRENQPEGFERTIVTLLAVTALLLIFS
jgi:hypothetical protein